MELVINTFGTSLNRDSEGFIITNADGRQRIPTDGIRSIQISRGAQITSDAVMLAVEREIEVIFCDRSGKPVARIWSPKYGSVSTIRKGQLAFSFSSDAVKWIKEVIARKIENQQAMLLMIDSGGAYGKSIIDKAINRLEDYRKKVSAIQGDIVADVAPTLRGWEGVASRIYFDTINNFLPEEYRFSKRSQHPAMDVANALLNYGYGLLYGRIEGALIKSGIDPYIGIMHRDDYNRPVLVYDVIEVFRVWIDYVVVSLLMQRAISDEHYSVRDDGSCWLEALGRRIIIQSVNDYLEEVASDDEDTASPAKSRQTQLMLYAQRLAQIFKQFKSTTP